MYLEDALTSFILRFYDFARRLIAKLQKNVFFTPVFGPIMAVQYSKCIQNEYISIAELFIRLEDGVTSIILRFYNVARRLIAKLLTKCNCYPVFGLTMGNTGRNAFEIIVLLQYINSSIMFKVYPFTYFYQHQCNKIQENYHFTPCFGGTMGIVDVNCI